MNRLADPRHQAGYLQLMADLRRPGCPVCRGTGRAAWTYLEAFFWESVNDPDFRTRLRASHGFCREHALLAARVVAETSGALGAAILTADLLRHIRREVEVEAARPRRRRGSADRHRRRSDRGHSLVRTARCPVCHSVRQLTDTYLKLLGEADPDSELGLAAREPGPCLCVPHLLIGLSPTTTSASRLRLIEIYARADDELMSELEGFIRKHDYRFHDEPMTEGEASSWLRAFHRLVGGPRPRSKPER